MKPVLNSIHALWRKSEREAYRSIHAKTRRHMADHFFNFCVTAHAMRDFFFELKNIPRGARAPYHAEWNRDSQILAVKEIANLSKHFELRDHQTGELQASRTRRVVHKRGVMVEIYVNARGDIKTVERPGPAIHVLTSDGARYDLWEFVVDVADFWRAYLREQGILVRRQPVRELLDEPVRASNIG